MTENPTYDQIVVALILAFQGEIVAEIERIWPKDGPAAKRRQIATKIIQARGGDPNQVEMGVYYPGKLMTPTTGPGGGICLRLPIVPAWMNLLHLVDEVLAAQSSIEAGL